MYYINSQCVFNINEKTGEETKLNNKSEVPLYLLIYLSNKLNIPLTANLYLSNVEEAMIYFMSNGFQKPKKL